MISDLPTCVKVPFSECKPTLVGNSLRLHIESDPVAVAITTSKVRKFNGSLHSKFYSVPYASPEAAKWITASCAFHWAIALEGIRSGHSHTFYTHTHTPSTHTFLLIALSISCYIDKNIALHSVPKRAPRKESYFIWKVNLFRRKTFVNEIANIFYLILLFYESILWTWKFLFNSFSISESIVSILLINCVWLIEEIKWRNGRNIFCLKSLILSFVVLS